jgi:hypothetical protein
MDTLPTAAGQCVPRESSHSFPSDPGGTPRFRSVTSVTNDA